jgi:hypothetical protein
MAKASVADDIVDGAVEVSPVRIDRYIGRLGNTVHPLWPHQPVCSELTSRTWATQIGSIYHPQEPPLL